MAHFDRYFLRLLIVYFCFFSLVLVGVFWIARSVSLFEKLMSGGQSVLVFFEFTALSLPTLIRTVMPMAIFGASAYATNRMARDSELTIMLATGTSPWRLARPVLVFGVLTGLMMAALTVFLRPASILQLELREAEVTRDLTAQLLNEGDFLHPSEGLSVFIRSIDNDGTLNDVYLSDRRIPARPVTYTAAKSFLVSDEGRAYLVMVDGMALHYDRENKTLSSTLFTDFSYDITSFTRDPDLTRRNIRAIPTLELIRDRTGVMERDGLTEGQAVEELHERFSWAGICIAVALVGFSTLMLGGYSRFGLWPQVVAAFFLLVLLEALRGVLGPVVLSRPDLWAVLYLPTAAGILLSAKFLGIAGRPLRQLIPRRARSASA